MKWSIAGLFSLGFIAATSAVVLVVSLQSGAQASEQGALAGDTPVVKRTASVLVASQDLDMRTVLDSSLVVVKSVPEGSAPEGALADPVEAVGKVLVRPMTAGQAFHPSYFAADSSALYLASAIKPGMRAVSVSLPEAMQLHGLLHPGSVVDVISSLTVDRDDGLGGQPVSRTLLEGVLVLAVGERTITSVGESSEDGGRLAGARTVTLAVSPEQAELLNLAMEEGKISLTLRNPADKNLVETDGASRAKLSPLIAEAERRALERQRELASQRSSSAQQDGLERERALIEQALKEMELARTRNEAPVPTASDSEWKTTIVRGGVSETKSFSRRDTTNKKSNEDPR